MKVNPFNGESTELAIHWEPSGAWQLTHAICGSSSINGILTARDKSIVDCKRCLKLIKNKEIK